MVAASKMKKVIQAALATRDYSQAAWEILTNISETYDQSNPLLDIREVKKICLILITPSKGLCGSLTSQLLKKVLQNINNPYDMMINRAWNKKIIPKIHPQSAIIDIVSIGKKGQDQIIKHKKNLIASFNQLNDQSRVDDIKPIAQLVLQGYREKKYDKIIMAYTDFISTTLYKPRLRQVLPISRKDLEKQLEELGEKISEKEEMEEIKEQAQKRIYTFEPSQEEVLGIIIPKVVESQIFQAFLESQASEFSARMITMKNASDAAQEMIHNFSLQYNQARQAAITQELSEISSGMLALEK